MSIPGRGRAPLRYAADDYPVVTDEEYQRDRERYGALSDEEARRYNLPYDVQREGQRSSELITRMNNQARLQEAARRIAEDRRQFDLTHGLDTQRFGLERERFGLEGQRFGADVLFRGAQLRGPLDLFQGQAYSRGVQTGGLAPYLQSLRAGGTSLPSGGTAMAGHPTPLTTQTLANEMSGQAGQSVAGGVSPTGPPSAAGAGTDQFGRPNLAPGYQQNLNAIGDVAQRGVANLGLGALERLTPGELDTFKSGLSYLGRDPDEELAAYQRSRPGQGLTSRA